MAEPLKNLYNEAFIQHLCKLLSSAALGFEKEKFTVKVFDSEWKSRELKQRMRHITKTLHDFLPDQFSDSIKIILQVTAHLKDHKTEMQLGYMILPDYIELYGIDEPEIALLAMEEVTQLISCEFAIRPFIIKYPEQMMQQMLKWSTHPNENVRRLSSEGCRPRLPWAMTLTELKKNPAPILPILNNLMNDESEFVRKSVANNLNDISKDHPNILINTVKYWKGHSKPTNWILKHASRTLLKAGNSEILKLFDFKYTKELQITHFKITTPIVQVGDTLDFAFQIRNSSNKATIIRLEYAIYYQKRNGTLSKKVYKISEKEYPPSSITNIKRKQSFKLITTRKFHAGKHELSLILNGVEMIKEEFELTL